MKVKRVTKATEHSEQLRVFIESLGVSASLTMYKSDVLVYIEAAPLFEILSVKEKAFLKTAEDITHYLFIDTLHISKYGVTKLLSMSREAISFRLQDYLYELFYRVETQGSVKIEDCTTREAFISELQTYKVADAQNRILYEETSTLLAEAREDANYWKQTAHDAVKQRDEAQLTVELLTEKLNVLKHNNVILCKYLKDHPKIHPDELYNSDDDDTPVTRKDAINAKRRIEAIEAKVTTILVKNKPSMQLQTIWLMREGDGPYKWTISAIAPDTKLLEISEDVLDGTLDYAEPIVYAILHISSEMLHAVKTFLHMCEGYADESTMNLLIQ